MFVFSREVQTKRFHAAPGMQIPRRLDTAYGRRYLRQQYGDDIIQEVDYTNPKGFLDVIGVKTGADVQAAYGKLKLLADQQAKELIELRRENEQLKKRLRLGSGVVEKKELNP